MQKASRSPKVPTAKSIQLQYVSWEEFIFSAWLAASKESPCKDWGATSGTHGEMIALEKPSCVFRLRISVHVHEENMKLPTINRDQYNADGLSISGTVAVLSKIDSYMTTYVASL